MHKESSQDKVYNYVRNQIISKNLFPGNRIVEENIIQGTGVSRTSIRPALVRLKYEGLVEIVPNRGTFVAKPSAEELEKVYRVRRILECSAFEDAVKYRTEKHLTQMLNNLKEQEKLPENYSRQEYVRLNQDFHWIIVKASGNEYYEKFLTEIYNRANSFMIFYDTSVGNDSLDTHMRMYEALRDQDIEKGRKAILEDIGIALRDMHDSGV